MTCVFLHAPCLVESDEMRNDMFLDENTGVRIFLPLFLLIVFLTAYIDYTFVGAYSSDGIVDMNYAQLVWEQKTLFPSGWYSTTEIFVNRPFFFPAFFYGVTGNFLLSYVLGIIAAGLLFSMITYQYLRFLEIDRAASFFGLCCFWGLFATWLYHFVFQAYYYSGVFSVIILTLWAYQSKKKILRYMTLLSAFMFGLASLRMVIFLYLPLLLMEIIHIVNNRNEINVNLKNLLYPLGLLSCNVFGYMVLCHVVKKHFAVFWGTAHIEFYQSAQDVFKAMISTIERIMDALQLTDPIMIVIVVMAILGTIYCTITSKLTLKCKQAIFFFCLSEAFVFVSSCLLNGLSSELTQRYHISVTFLITFMLIFLFNNMLKQHMRATIAAALSILIYGIGSNQGLIMYPEHFTNNKQAEFLAEYYTYTSCEMMVADYLRQSNVGRAYATYWNAEPLKLYSNGSIETGHFNSDLAPFLWGTEKRLYEQGEYNDTVAIVVRTDELEQFSDRGKTILQSGKLMNNIGGKYLVYFFDENPILIR